ncbi:MAG: hypothetical protein Q4E59_07360 [Bacteroidales bacterium]|nr:hypothetical protein [Bacteroidales bacterium]
MRKKLLILLLAPVLAAGLIHAQTAVDEDLSAAVGQYFSTYAVPNYVPVNAMKMDSCLINEAERLLFVYANESFCSQPFTPQSVARIYKELGRQLPPPFNTYRLTILSKKGQRIEDLIPNIYREDGEDRSRMWGDINYTGNPWVQNVSRPYSVSRGLAGRHLMVNASHGRYYRQGEWKWQRPRIFCTCEDLFTQSFVNPFLIPMLENAGAVVATARERDTQTFEAVVDNDAPERQGIYEEVVADDAAWANVNDSCGFAPPYGVLNDSILPFRLGTARQVGTTTRRSRLASATWTPRIPRAGSYAVYVSYATRPNSVSDAHYTVYHKGGRTQFRVNQQMGGGTWVYLGTFEFDEGQQRDGRVVLTNQSDYRGVVTADGVRFGGGVGQNERGTVGTSGLPRFLEGARYQAQWSGLPDTLYCRDDGTNDYNDDIRSRSYMLNYLGGGSTYMPGTAGRGVPFELALAVHSDAGVRADNAIYGTLGICTTVDGYGNTNYVSGISRQASSDFIAALMTTVTTDLSRIFNTSWTRRELWDRNYGETRTPDVPSAILEMFSHQNFTDMKYGHDPLFKFAMARAIYKGILHFVNYQHGVSHYEMQPLPVRNFAATLTDNGRVRLSWESTPDTINDNARPTGYVVYTKVGDEGFDNGQLVEGQRDFTMPLIEGQQYSFKVTAVNRGGESFPSEVLSVRRGAEGSKRVLIVNGFERLSGPARVERPDSLGFDLDEDLGVAYNYTTAFAGRQLCYNPATAGRDDSEGLGYSGTELVGQKIMGNTFDFPVLHGKAIAAAGDYTFASCSKAALLDGSVKLENYDMVDYICGLERDAPQNLRPYKTFDAATRRLLTDYLNDGGRLWVSGSFIGSDMQSAEERTFIRNVLKYDWAGTARTDSTGFVNGLNLTIPIRRTLSTDGYLLQSPDVIVPTTKQAFTAFAYGGGTSAGIAYAGSDYRVIAMGFPFECITDEQTRTLAAGALIKFLTQ